jgi:ribosomal-protein-alanine N-acetyltransferase
MDADVAGVFAVYSDDEVTKFSEMVTLANFAQASQVVKRFQVEFEQDIGVRWAIALRADGKLIGTCGLGWHRQNFSAYLSYDLERRFWNQGIATDALAAVVRHGFTTTNLNRMSATTVPENGASMRVLQKLGFQEEGILREWGYWKGHFQDLRCFSLLRKDFIAADAQPK